MWEYDGNWGRRYVLLAEDRSLLLTYELKGFWRTGFELLTPNRTWHVRSKGLFQLRYEAADSRTETPVAFLKWRLFGLRHVANLETHSGSVYPVQMRRGFRLRVSVLTPDGRPLFEQEGRFNWHKFRQETRVKLYPAAREEPLVLLFVGLTYAVIQRVRRSRNNG